MQGRSCIAAPGHVALLAYSLPVLMLRWLGLVADQHSLTFGLRLPICNQTQPLLHGPCQIEG